MKTLKGIVTNSVDYLEKDKIITMLTLEEGYVTVRAKSIKASTAKLKFAGELLAFCDFQIVSGKGNSLVGATPIQLFYEIRKDLERFYLAMAIPPYLKEGSPDDFIFLMKGLIALNDFQGNLKILSLKVLTELAKHLGYTLNYHICGICGKPLSSGSFSVASQGFVCHECGNADLNEDFFAFGKSFQDKSLKKLLQEDLDLSKISLHFGFLRKHLENIEGKKDKTLRAVEDML